MSLSWLTTTGFSTSALGAWATPAQQGPSAMANIIFIVLIIVVFYFLLIRPQTKRAKEHREMVEALDKGDEVVTSGGLLGKIVEMDKNFITLEIAPNVSIHVQRHAVTAVMPKGTIKSL